MSRQSILFEIEVIQSCTEPRPIGRVAESCSIVDVVVFALFKTWTIFIAAALRILPELSVFCRAKALILLI
jgi:hypothetical protein